MINPSANQNLHVLKIQLTNGDPVLVGVSESYGRDLIVRYANKALPEVIGQPNIPLPWTVHVEDIASMQLFPADALKAPAAGPGYWPRAGGGSGLN